MKKSIKIILALLSLVVIAIVIAQVGEIEGGAVYAMAIAVFTKACEKNTGGNTRVFLGEAANLSSVTITSGEVSAITMATGKSIFEIQADIDTVIRTDTGVGTRSNVSYTKRIEMQFMKPTKDLNTLSDSLTAASPCGIIAIVQDANGKSWLIGYNATDAANRGLFVVDDTVNSAAEPDADDGNIATIALETKSGYKDLPFDATENAAIIGDTATYITNV